MRDVETLQRGEISDLNFCLCRYLLHETLQLSIWFVVKLDNFVQIHADSNLNIFNFQT